MLKFVINLYLIVLVVIHAADADDGKHNGRRVKRLGAGSGNKFKKEVWKQDVGDQFQIEPSTDSVQNVHLKCGSNSMFVKLEASADFSGVMYTKGNFYDQSEPCFVKPKRSRSGSLSMRFTFDQCNTKQDGNVFSNVIVVQNDPELVTPGDAAFSLLCDFRKPRNLNVEGNYEARGRRPSEEESDGGPRASPTDDIIY